MYCMEVNAKKGEFVMTLIGMLHHRKDPSTVIKSYAYAAVAKAEGAKFVYFTPGSVNLVNKSIRGQVYENGKWLERICHFLMLFTMPGVLKN